jgi:hypothetical protein
VAEETEFPPDRKMQAFFYILILRPEKSVEIFNFDALKISDFQTLRFFDDFKRVAFGAIEIYDFE